MQTMQIYEKFAKLERLLKRRQMQTGNEPGRHPMDPARGQGRVIAALQMKDGISTKELSYLLDMTPPSLNEMLAKLAKAGLVERRSAEEDKRVILNYITEDGKAVCAQQEEEDVQFLDCLTQEEQQVLDGLLGRIIENLEQKLEQRQELGMDGPAEGPGGWGRPRRPGGPKPKKFAPMRPPKPNRPER